MLTAWYIGDHDDDGYLARLGYKITRIGQVRQLFGQVTHCEAILDVGFDGIHRIAGASLRDKGVRVKLTELNREHWTILDVPLWDRVRCLAWFEAKSALKIPYSALGAASSASPLVSLCLDAAGVDRLAIGQWCSRALGESVGVIGSEDMNVSELMTLSWNMPGTRDVTRKFFGGLVRK